MGAGNFHFDELPNPTCEFPADVDEAKLRRFLHLAGIEFSGGAEALLLNLDVAQRQRSRITLNNAAVFFFAKEPQRFLRESYCTAVSPFEVTSTNFFVMRFFPRIKSAARIQLTPRQAKLHQFLGERGVVSKRDAAAWLGVSEDTALRELTILTRHGLVSRQGNGKATRYAITS